MVARMLSSKTFWVSVLASLGTIGLWLDGQITTPTMLQTITGSALAVTIRDTLAGRKSS